MRKLWSNFKNGIINVIVWVLEFLAKTYVLNLLCATTAGWLYRWNKPTFVIYVVMLALTESERHVFRLDRVHEDVETLLARLRALIDALGKVHNEAQEEKRKQD